MSLKYPNEENPVILPGICMFNQPNPFETQVTVILIFKMENKNRERWAPSCGRTCHYKFQFLFLVWHRISVGWLDFACFFFPMSLHIYYFLWTFYFILGYSCLTMLWWFQTHSKVTQPYIHMYPFSPNLPSHSGCHITLSRVPCAIHAVGPYPLSILSIAVCTNWSQTP